MSSTLRVSLVVQTSDYGQKPCSSGDRVGDLSPTTHDLIDVSPVGPLATSGAVGVAFVGVPTPVVQVQRLLVDLATGADVLLRLNGSAALVLGASGALTLTDGLTLLFAGDGGSTITAEFLATDTTPLLAAKRINYAAGAQVASVDTATAKLRLDGVKTGGPWARAKSRSFGALDILSGTALAALGLVAGTYSGDGDDLRVGSGAQLLRFPASAQPQRIELSGSASGARIWVARTAA